LDLIVIDEAGQFALANTLAASSAGKRALLLGDPQQLPQVSQATHPEAIETSVLSHIMGDHKTIPDEYGYFLDATHRMHPELTKYVSRLQYENRLHSDPVCSKRALQGVLPGLRVVEVEHEGNTVKSEEEASEILNRIPELLGKKWIDADNSGGVKPGRDITQQDIIVVAAYNRQVRHIKSLLTKNGYADIRVGTVDKFQGQEAPIVFVSMATSSSEDLPRGIEFLLSPNRLNVAISRAQWACFLLRSPQLARMEPASAKGMIFLGKFISLCR
jgi:superfamily I DNA and/or RNA helicase